MTKKALIGPTSEQSPSAQRLLKLRRQGKSWQQIAAKFNPREFEELRAEYAQTQAMVRETYEDVVQAELARLDKIIRDIEAVQGKNSHMYMAMFRAIELRLKAASPLQGQSVTTTSQASQTETMVTDGDMAVLVKAISAAKIIASTQPFDDIPPQVPISSALQMIQAARKRMPNG